MGGISRFFDGYDWEPIVLLDDPVEPSKMTDSIELAAMKNLINEHERFVEIKNHNTYVYTCRLDLLENVGEEEAATTVATAATTTTTTYGYDGYMILDELYKHHVTILNFISIKNCINL